jgi:hypothetical protein
MRPSDKVLAGGTAGAATLVGVWIAGLFGLEVPVEVGIAISVLVSSAAGWVKKEKRG